MKILLVNKFYYRRGGDCIYMLNLEQLLKGYGNKVAVFAMDYPENLDTVWKTYFPSEIKFKPGLGMVEAFMRPFGTNEVRKKFNELLDDFRPDVVHLNNIHSQLSPIIAELANKRGIKVVWTLHDYKLLCPRYDCLRNGETICEECFTDKHKVLKYKCMKNSMLASYLSYREIQIWNRKRLEACTDKFVCPSRFMMNKMREGGFDNNKLTFLCNFIDILKCQYDNFEKEDYCCFIGRLSHEKGVKTLIEAINSLPDRKLVIVGDGPLDSEMKVLARKNIEFVGFKQWNEIKTIVGKARFTIIPSEWYENNPLSVIEAQCLGTPVLGARIGGIPELIEEGVTGMTFESRDVGQLAQKIEIMFVTKFDYKTIADKSQDKYNAENYYSEIMKLYEQ